MYNVDRGVELKYHFYKWKDRANEGLLYFRIISSDP